MRRAAPRGTAKPKTDESAVGVWAMVVGVAALGAIIVLGIALWVTRQHATALQDGESKAWSVNGRLLSLYQHSQGELQEAQSLHASSVRALAQEEKRTRDLSEDLEDARHRQNDMAVNVDKERQEWRDYGTGLKSQLETESMQRHEEGTAARMTIAQLERKEAALTEQHEAAQQRSEQLAGELTQAEKLMDGLNADRSQLIQANNQLRASESASLSEITRLRSCNASLEAEVRRLEACLNELRSRSRSPEKEGEHDHHAPRDRRP